MRYQIIFLFLFSTYTFAQSVKDNFTYTPSVEIKDIGAVIKIDLKNNSESTVTCKFKHVVTLKMKMRYDGAEARYENQIVIIEDEIDLGAGQEKKYERVHKNEDIGFMNTQSRYCEEVVSSKREIFSVVEWKISEEMKDKLNNSGLIILESGKSHKMDLGIGMESTIDLVDGKLKLSTTNNTSKKKKGFLVVLIYNFRKNILEGRYFWFGESNGMEYQSIKPNERGISDQSHQFYPPYIFKPIAAHVYGKSSDGYPTSTMYINGKFIESKFSSQWKTRSNGDSYRVREFTSDQGKYSCEYVKSQLPLKGNEKLRYDVLQVFFNDEMVQVSGQNGDSEIKKTEENNSKNDNSEIKKNSVNEKSIKEKLKELQELKEEGLITEEDYQKKKEELLKNYK